MIGNESRERGRTIILLCSCKSSFQDSKYGRGKRVFNIALGNKARCTVCSREQSI